MSAPRAAMIMTAGFGTRMGELTRHTPKPLLQAGGRALIDISLDLCTEAGITRTVLNLHYLGDAIRRHLSARELPEIRFSEEHPDILDTGGGVVNALALLGEQPFVTANPDAVFDGPNPIAHLGAAWNPQVMDALMLLIPRPHAQCYERPGDFFLESDGAMPVRRGERTTAPFVYSGLQIIHPKAFRDPPSRVFSTNVIWDRLAAQGRLAAISYPGRWIDVGTPQGLAAADALLADHTP